MTSSYALAGRGIGVCIPCKTSPKAPVPHDPAFHHQRQRFGNTFAGLWDWARIATRYDGRADLYLRPIAFAAIVISWLNTSTMEALAESRDLLTVVSGVQRAATDEGSGAFRCRRPNSGLGTAGRPPD